MKSNFPVRANIIASLLLIGAALIVLRIIFVQTSKEAELFRVWGDANSWTTKPLYPERGRIFYSDGYMAAGNQSIYEIGVTYSQVRDAHTIAQTLQDVLGMDYQDTFDKITHPIKNVIYISLNSFVPTDKALRLQQMQTDMSDKATSSTSPNLDGLHFRKYLIRSYPDKTLASNVIGFVDRDNNGVNGVEQKYNSLLAGVPITVKVPLDPNLVGEMPKTPSGADLILTIDRNIQAMAEEEIKKGVEGTSAVSGTIVIMDPHTGAILAMASTPQVDLNNLSNYRELFAHTAFNQAVSTAYEPGSVFKPLVMAAAIDTNLVSPQTTYLDTGFYEIGGVYIHNWDNGAWGVQNMIGCLQNSLNVCMSRLADLMGPDTFYTYIRRFGIGHPTNIDLANEASGTLRTPEDNNYLKSTDDPVWYKVDLGTNSFGQGVTVTPIQLLTAASALANDGKMVQPHVVYALISNGIQHTTPVQTIGQPISAQTAHTVSEMMAEAMENGHSSALIDGYRIAGKTGTASVPKDTGGYYDDKINASYLGWAPVDNPKFMVYIWLEQPHADWASYVAAPIFHSVAEKLVVLMNLPPDAIRKQLTGQ